MSDCRNYQLMDVPMVRRRFFGWIVLCSTSILLPAQAADSSSTAAEASRPPTTSAGAAEASLALWSRRSDPLTARATLQAFQRWSAAAPADATPLVLFSRATYWYAWLLNAFAASERLEMLKQGLAAGRQAATLAPKNPGGDFWAACNLGVYGKLKGITNSVSSLPEIRERLARVEALDTRYYHGGVWRYYGRLIDEVPSTLRMIYGYDLEDAIQFYEKSLQLEPGYVQTYIYLAECLIDQKESQRARTLLEQALRLDTSKLVDAVPENQLFVKEARQLLARAFP